MLNMTEWPRDTTFFCQCQCHFLVILINYYGHFWGQMLLFREVIAHVPESARQGHLETLQPLQSYLNLMLSRIAPEGQCVEVKREVRRLIPLTKLGVF